MKVNRESNIVIMATYWNEIEWIKPSLEQIKKINPKKAIICDGCFDPKYKNGSTDGTEEKIKDFCDESKDYVKIKAIRKSKVNHLMDWVKHKNPSSNILSKFIAKLYGVTVILRTDVYRLNQMATFQYMLEELSDIKNNDWFMTYDCDQFYSEEIIKKIHQIELYNDYSILTCEENTFFEDFDNYTDKYEKRDYNNMPHKYTEGLRFIPTRHPAKIYNNKYVNMSNFEKQKLLIGEVYHYHIKSPERKNAGYSLGDRKPPSKERTLTQEFQGIHPDVVSEYFGLNSSKDNN